MAFIKNTDSDSWKVFLVKNSDLLMKTGLPEDHYSTEKVWLDFLEHGFIDHHEVIHRFTLSDMDDVEYENYLSCVKEYINITDDNIYPVLRNTNDL